MICSTLPSGERLDQLLADRAVFGLAPEETDELDTLLSNYAVFDEEAYERTVATIDLALGPAHFEPLSPGIATKVQQQAAAHASQQFHHVAHLDR